MQIFRAAEDHLSWVSLAIPTYQRRLRSALSFALHEIEGGEDRVLLRATEEGATFVDNEPHDLYFTPQPRSRGRLYLLRIGSAGTDWDDAATVWLDPREERIAGHVACFYGGQHQADYGIVAQTGYSPPTPYRALPAHIVLSPVTQCNLNCVHCISADTRRRVSRLPDEIREQVRAWCRDGLVESLHTDYSGDILWADARFGGELDFVIGLDVPFHVDTSGTHLTRERSARLVGSKMRSLNVSLDAATDATYRRIRRGAPPLASVIENVAAFADVRQRAGARSRISLSLGFTLMRSNLDELPAFVTLAREVGAEWIACRHVEAYTADMEPESLWLEPDRFNRMRRETLAAAAQAGIAVAIPEPFVERPSRPGHRPCLVPWNDAVILGNGDVQVCCLPKTKIGNLHEETLEQIWAGQRYAAFRMAVNSDRAPACCRACAYARRPGNADSYLPHRTIAEWKVPYDVG